MNPNLSSVGKAVMHCHYGNITCGLHIPLETFEGRRVGASVFDISSAPLPLASVAFDAAEVMED